MDCDQRLVCMKKVKQIIPGQWNESMLLPGDIIEGIAKDDAESIFIQAKARSKLRSELRKFSRQTDAIWVKVKRGDSSLKLQACLTKEGCPKLQRKYTIRAASDERHVAVLDYLTLEECTRLQESSRKVVNMDSRGYNQEGIKYNWKTKVSTYLPDERSPVVSSILFMPLANEHNIEATTVRTMAWFSAAVSSGVPLFFVNIQTEQIINSKRSNTSVKEIKWIRQKKCNSEIQTVTGIRLWFLPGVAEESIKLIPEMGETKFGINVRRTDEGFICISSVTKGAGAERAGLGHLLEQAIKTGRSAIISRLEGKSLMPSTVSTGGLIYCSDIADVQETLSSALEKMDSIQVHIMSWPNMIRQASQAYPSSTLLPPQ